MVSIPIDWRCDCSVCTEIQSGLESLCPSVVVSVLVCGGRPTAPQTQLSTVLSVVRGRAPGGAASRSDTVPLVNNSALSSWFMQESAHWEAGVRRVCFDTCVLKWVLFHQLTLSAKNSILFTLSQDEFELGYPQV